MAVIGFETRRRFSYAQGRAFGNVGAYEQIDGTLTFAVDPAHPANREIVDLGLAPRDASGRVRFRADGGQPFLITVEVKSRNAGLSEEYVNRVPIGGRSAAGISMLGNKALVSVFVSS